MNSVFLIDDQVSVRRALGEMLQVFGFSVELYDSAQSFLNDFNPTKGGCIVADVRMDGIDGIELLHELSRRKITLPVVLISGHADVPMAVAGIKAGAEDLIEKPIDDRQLVAAINRGMARYFDQHVANKRVPAVVGRRIFTFDASPSGDFRHGRQWHDKPSNRFKARN